MKKLNEVLKTNKVVAYGFSAFKELENKCNPDGIPCVISTLAPGLMLDKGIATYYSPVIPRNTTFTCADDIIKADLDVVTTTVSSR